MEYFISRQGQTNLSPCLTVSSQYWIVICQKKKNKYSSSPSPARFRQNLFGSIRSIWFWSVLNTFFIPHFWSIKWFVNPQLIIWTTRGVGLHTTPQQHTRTLFGSSCKILRRLPIYFIYQPRCDLFEIFKIRNPFLGYGSHHPNLQDFYWDSNISSSLLVSQVVVLEATWDGFFDENVLIFLE